MNKIILYNDWLEYISIKFKNFYDDRKNLKNQNNILIYYD